MGPMVASAKNTNTRTHAHIYTQGWGRGEARGLKVLKDSSNSQINRDEFVQQKKKKERKVLWWTGGGGASLTSAQVWEPCGCSKEDFWLIIMWMDSESREVEETGSFIKHCLHNVASRGVSRVFTNHAVGFGSQGSVLSVRFCPQAKLHGTAATDRPQSHVGWWGV